MKIALIGSAPSSVRLAPYHDPEWQIWGCSPGAFGHAGPHAHAWFEMHRWEPQVPGHVGTGQPWFSPEYCEFLTRFAGPVWMADPVPPEVRNGRAYPMHEMIDKYGPYFMTSSLSWMFALALETPGVTEIGLFGVDMAAAEEYGYQRAGCQYYITLATQRGIKVTVPPESDLLQPAYFYGVTENTPMMIKLTARLNELKPRLHNCEVNMQNLRDEAMFLKGAIDNIDYMIKTWTAFQSFIEPTMGKTGNEGRAAPVAPENKYAHIPNMTEEQLTGLYDSLKRAVIHATPVGLNDKNLPPVFDPSSQTVAGGAIAAVENKHAHSFENIPEDIAQDYVRAQLNHFNRDQ
jgi:hypothetical protein